MDWRGGLMNADQPQTMPEGAVVGTRGLKRLEMLDEEGQELELVSEGSEDLRKCFVPSCLGPLVQSLPETSTRSVALVPSARAK